MNLEARLIDYVYSHRAINPRASYLAKRKEKWEYSQKLKNRKKLVSANLAEAPIASKVSVWTRLKHKVSHNHVFAT